NESWSVTTVSMGNPHCLTFAAQPQGFERGFTIWIGLVSACGFLGLLIAAWNKELHLPSVLACLPLLLISLGISRL
ncbi:MAG: hypothetical protein AAF197_03385, partial [Pseudomonadota bacterium]